MNKIEIKAGEWVVVCDGARALIFENAGDEKFPNLQMRETYEQDNPPTREHGTDAPGRSFSSMGTRRSAVSQTDWHDLAEKAFLEGVVKRLDLALAGGLARSFVIVAPPRALGMMRPAFTPAVRAAVSSEVAKDLVKLPSHEIERYLTN